MNLSHYEKKNNFNLYTDSLNEAQISGVTKKIHWFKHWLRDRERSEIFSDLKTDTLNERTLKPVTTS